MEYKNPIISGFNPDPSVCKVDGVYYLVTSSFEYFPGVPIYRSHDLINWDLIGHCLTRENQLDLTNIKSSQGIFAPTLRYINGMFYMITTCVGGCGHFYVKAKEPDGEWSDPIIVAGDGFDPDLFQDVDGKIYLTRQNMIGGIIQYEIDLESGRLLDKGTIIWNGFEDFHCEGPHIYKIGNWYYLLVAEGGTHIGHMGVIARSKKVDGPYQSYVKNPILTHRGRTDTEIKALGHGDLVQDVHGDWWIVFLGIRQVGNWNDGFWHHLGRETFLAPVEFDEEGWLKVNRGKPISINMKVIGRKEVVLAKNTNNKQVFYRRGNRSSDLIEILDSNTVNIYYSNEKLDSILCPTFLGIKQSHFDCKFEAEVTAPIRDDQEVGLTVIMNENFHYEIAFTKGIKGIELLFRKTVGDLCLLENRSILPEDNQNMLSIKMFIRATKYKYEFGYYLESREYTLGTGSTKFLSSEVSAGFTGVFLGVYTSGNSLVVREKACFKDIQYII